MKVLDAETMPPRVLDIQCKVHNTYPITIHSVVYCLLLLCTGLYNVAVFGVSEFLLLNTDGGCVSTCNIRCGLICRCSRNLCEPSRGK
jgi:hypothetical protein